MDHKTSTNHNESWKEKPPSKALNLTLIGITVFVLLVMAGALPLVDIEGLKNIFGRYKGGQVVPSVKQGPVLRDVPRLQVDERADIDAYKKAEQERLSAYRKTEDGRIQIPVEQAMKRIVEQGLPARKRD